MKKNSFMKSVRALFFAVALLICSIPTTAQMSTSLLTNKSGGTVSQYSVVVVDTANNSAFTTTATERVATVVGVAIADISNNVKGKVGLPGQILTIRVTGLVTRGDYLITSTSAGYAKSGGTTDISGAFGIALETGTSTNIQAYIFAPALLGSSSAFTISTLTVTGSGTYNDDIDIRFGTDLDIRFRYDETTDNRGEWHDGTNLLGYITDAGTTGNWGITGSLLANTIALHSGTTATLYNTVATTVNAFGAATTITFGAATGTCTIANATVAISGATAFNVTPPATFTGDIADNGGDFTSTQTTFNLLNSTVTSLNFAGAATTLNIGNASGTTNWSGTVDFASRIALGSAGAPSAGSQIYIIHRPTDTTGSVYGQQVYLQPNAGGSSSASYIGMGFILSAYSAQTYSSGISGVNGIIDTGIAGSTVAVGRGINVGTWNSGAGTITTATGLYVDVYGTVGSIPTWQGIQIDTNTDTGATAVGSTNKYGINIGAIYGASALNYALYTNAGEASLGDVLALRTVTAITADDATPDVSTGNHFTIPSTWTAAANITMFDAGTTGQVIYITAAPGDTDCVVTDGGNLLIAGNWTADPGDTLTLWFNGTNWYELARAAN